MKVEIHRKSFLTALEAVSGVAPSKSPKPILQSVKFIAENTFDRPDDEGPVLLATDLEIGVRYRVRNVKVIEPGSAVLSPGQLSKILSKATCDALTIEVDSDTIKIRGKKVKYDLPSEDPSLFPDPPAFTATNYHTVVAADLVRLITRTIFAVDCENTQYALGGVCAELRLGQIVMIATDGRRLAEAKASADVVGSPAEYVNGGLDGCKQAPIIPLKALTTLKKVLAKTLTGDPPVAISVQGDSGIVFQTERVTLHTRGVEGRFPRYQNVFPGSAGTIINLPAGEFREAVEQAAITTSDTTRGVEFCFTSGRLKLAAQAAEVGKSEIEMDLPDFSGPETWVKFDANYLRDALGAIGDDATIKGDFRTKEGNVLCVGDDYRYAIMPQVMDR